MKSIFFGFALAAHLMSCQTIQSEQRFQMTPSLRDSLVHCSLLLPSEPQKILTVELSFPATSDHAASLNLKLSQETSYRQISAVITEDGTVTFNASEKDRLLVSLMGKPKISHLDREKDTSSATPCIQLVVTTNNQKPANCQAVGTPAEGWYQAGKVIQHSHSCSSELLTCGSAPQKGWYVQKKTNKKLLKQEECGRQRSGLLCKTMGQVTGWYRDQDLISVDDSCIRKSIECNGIGTTSEGWFTYEKTSPQLLVADTCQSSRNISYLSH